MMPRQEDAERGALTGLGVDIDKAAGLLDDAIHRRQAEAGALADFLGREERLKDLVDDLRGNAGAGVDDIDPHIFRRRHALVGEAPGLLRCHVGGSNRQRAAIGHRIAGVNGQIDDHLLELRQIRLDRPQVATMQHFQFYLLTDQSL